MGNTVFFREAAKEDSKIEWKDIFSESFVKHSKADREYAMQTGTVARQVPEGRMLSTWQRPWLWWPMAKAGLLLIVFLYAALYIPAIYFGTSTSAMFEMCVIIPPLIIPLIMMIFFWELNIPQNISLGDMGCFYIVAGVISFVVTALAFLLVPSELPAKYASLREEPAKLAATLLILYYIQNKQGKKIYGLTGLVVGAAVGAAFSGLESVSYALNATGGGLEAVIFNQVLRGLFAIAGHVAYCIPYSCAIALNAQDGKINLSSVFCPQTMLALLLSIVLHWIWNSRGMLTLILLCCFAPFRYIYWIRKCLTQIVTICGPARRDPQSVPPMGAISLRCQSTALQGMIWQGLTAPVIIGRQQGSCAICFPVDTPGVSREHCRVYPGDGGWMVQDMGSTYGTYVDGKKLTPFESVPVRSGSNIYLGSRQVWITVQ